jgi:hypothetical protein
MEIKFLLSVWHFLFQVGGSLLFVRHLMLELNNPVLETHLASASALPGEKSVPLEGPLYSTRTSQCLFRSFLKFSSNVVFIPFLSQY